MPLYTAILAALLLHDEPLRARLLAGVALALAGLALAFVESLELGSEDRAALGALAVVLSPLGAALGNVAIKRRAGGLDAIVVNGWGMLIGGGAAARRAPRCPRTGATRCGARRRSARSSTSRSSAPPSRSSTLTVLLREMSAQASSFIALMIPFGALAFGALLYDEAITGRAVAGAALVVAGLLAARGRTPAPMRRRTAPPPPEQVAA